MSMSMLDFVNTVLNAEETLTKSEFTSIRNSGDEAALIEAVQKMEDMGGYDNLPD